MTSQSFNEDTLTDAEYEIYQYLLNTDISNLTAGEIAKHFFVGRTMIYRVCQKMGFHTFTELKYSRQQEQADDFELSIEQLNTQISFSHLHPIALEIRGANRVFLYGTIASTIATEYFERQLINLGCFAVQINDRFQFEQRARGFTKGDVLVCISSSGKNTDMNGVISTITIPIIAITKRNSPLHTTLSTLCIDYNLDNYQSRNAFDRENLFPLFVIIQKVLLALR